jgi:hypothetical protein
MWIRVSNREDFADLRRVPTKDAKGPLVFFDFGRRRPTDAKSANVLRSCAGGKMATKDTTYTKDDLTGVAWRSRKSCQENKKLQDRSTDVLFLEIGAHGVILKQRFYRGRSRPVCARAMGVVVDGSGVESRIWRYDFFVGVGARVPDCARTALSWGNQLCVFPTTG